MQFKAHYIETKPGHDGNLYEYWITIHADTLSEADKIHRQRRKKNYTCGALIESQYVNNN